MIPRRLTRQLSNDHSIGRPGHKPKTKDDQEQALLPGDHPDAGGHGQLHAERSAVLSEVLQASTPPSWDGGQAMQGPAIWPSRQLGASALSLPESQTALLPASDIAPSDATALGLLGSQTALFSAADIASAYANVSKLMESATALRSPSPDDTP